MKQGTGNDMGKLYLLFKTDDIKRGIVAAHESSDIITKYLESNREIFEPKKLGQGWEIDLLMYDETGKSNLTPIKKYTKELENCSPDEIREGIRYNIAYKNNGKDIARKIVRTKCIKACPPEFIFDNNTDSGLQLQYNDIIVITKCRDNEDSDDVDRFIYYSYLYEWKLEHGKS